MTHNNEEIIWTVKKNIGCMPKHIRKKESERNCRNCQWLREDREYRPDGSYRITGFTCTMDWNHITKTYCGRERIPEKELDTGCKFFKYDDKRPDFTCPYCQMYLLDWDDIEVSAKWNDEAVDVFTKNIRCMDKNCKGSSGFTIKCTLYPDEETGLGYDEEYILDD